MRERAFVLMLCALIGGAACGKKGPPLPPLVRLPAAVGDLSARRLSQDVILQFTVPTANADGSRPADLDRIEVYAHTGALRAPADYVMQGTLIGTVAAKPLPPAETESKEAQTRAAAAAAAGANPLLLLQGADQGARVSVSEILTPEVLAFTPPASPTPATPPTLPTPPTPPIMVQTPGGASNAASGTTTGPGAPASTNAQAAQKQPGRYYVAVGINRRGRMGAFSPVIGVPLVTAPPAPTGAEVTYDEKTISIGWTPPAVSEPQVESEPVDSKPTANSTAASSQPVFNYNIYETTESPDKDVAVPTPVNPSPVAAAPLALTALEFGRPRCYTVRTVATVDGVMIASEPSPAACVTPIDTFPPAAPRALAAVPTPTAVSLIWEANTEPDLAGYLVLRGEAPGEKLTPLTPVPILETTFNDTQVRPAVTYVYAVVAQDNATPPNVSPYSELLSVITR